MQLTLELLAPAKNRDIGIAAIDCGADAVYIAGPAFGAREAASNSIQEVEALASYAHRYGASCYLTLNTILYENELEEARTLAYNAFQAGVDALIVQDLALLKMDLPSIPLFASTQTNLRTPEQARFLESLGFKRLILERGLSLEQIKQIRKAVSCDIETFVHGALCVSYSGQCYLSEHLAGRSANRGVCAQACRSRYDLVGSDGSIIVKDKSLLSLKDLSLASHIGDLIHSGVNSFKIEGRLKNISYIKNITRLYRNIIDTQIANSDYRKSSFGELHGGFVPNQDYTFNRGYTSYFFEGKRGKWNSSDSSKSLGEYLGKVDNIISNNNTQTVFTIEGKLPSNGDGLSYQLPNGEIAGVRADVVKNNTITTKSIPSLASGNSIWRNRHSAFEKELENNMPHRLIDAYITFVSSDNKITLTTKSDDGKSAEIVVEESYDIAKNRELALSNIHNCFEKSSEQYLFHLSKINCDLPRFYPLSYLNSLRNALAAKLNSETKTSSYKRAIHSVVPPSQKTLLNCANTLSKELYKEIGIDASPAFELAPTPEFPILRSKYCIKYELGLCPSQHSGKHLAEPLYLTNQGRKLRLFFDCSHCEMVIFS